MTDSVETLGDVGIQHILRFLVDAHVNGSNGIVTGSSWSEAIAVGFEFGFPFGFQSEDHQRLASAVGKGRNAERPLFIGARFGNPDPTDGLWRGLQTQGGDKIQAFFRFQVGDPIDPGSFFALVVLSDFPGGQTTGGPGVEQQTLEVVDFLGFAPLGSSVDSSLELVDFPFDF